MSKTTLRWGIIGPGGIAKTFSAALQKSATSTLIAIGSRNPGKASLAENFAGVQVVHGYEALLSRADIDVIYIATPHLNHVEWAVKTLQAGKHVLVEKPIALTAAGARRIYDEARRLNLFAGEAFMYRPHPLTQRLVELVRDGAIGAPRIIRATIGFNAREILPGHRLFDKSLAGGAILDLGGYPASIIRLIAGASEGKPFLDPEEVSGVAHIGETGVDLWASGIVRFAGGILGEMSISMLADQDNALQVFGSAGRIKLVNFWSASGKEGGVGRIELTVGDHISIHEVREDRWLYTFEIDALADAIAAGRLEFDTPGMGWADSLGNMSVLDKWRQSVGLSYFEAEQAEQQAF
ncbi:MAG: hypothetical protein ABS75_26080 [Pelagibacterium sp. SCN 63-23]|nr:MAG: hypothetical protein ABS75_26080 [Pelagibacterium sp. SCN 63-23]